MNCYVRKPWEGSKSNIPLIKCVASAVTGVALRAWGFGEAVSFVQSDSFVGSGDGFEIHFGVARGFGLFKNEIQHFLGFSVTPC